MNFHGWPYRIFTAAACGAAFLIGSPDSASEATKWCCFIVMTAAGTGLQLSFTLKR